MTESLTGMLDKFEEQVAILSVNGITNLQEPLIAMLTSFAIISIITNWEMYFSANYSIANIVVKLMHFGFLAMLLKNWAKIINMFQETAENIGLLAGGQTEMLKVTSFVNLYVGKLFTAWGNVWAKFSFISDSIVLALIANLIIALTIVLIFAMAYEVFMATNEFIIVGTLLMVLVPFNALHFTQDFGGKAWGGLLSLFVKLMVTVFFFSLVTVLVDDTLGKEVVLNKDKLDTAVPNMAMMLAALAFLFYMMKSATELATSIVSGAIIGRGANIVTSAPQYAMSTYRGAMTGYAMGRTAGRWGYKAGKAGYAAGKQAYQGAKKAAGWLKNLSRYR